MKAIEIRRGTYRDSVELMRVSRLVGTEPGVGAAFVAMATPLNIDLAGGMGFALADGATPNDMLVAIDAADDAALSGARARLDAALRDHREDAGGTSGGPPTPRTVGSAARRSGANLALISTPGAHAFLDAVDALHAGLSVMVFSDNMPVEQEVSLKELAAQRGLLVMGPDCGTALIGGVGLGFANIVRPGPVGLVAASGTGAQQVMCLLDEAGTGVSHCIGVGSRDLSAPVDGRSTLAALRMLDDDPATELIVVVSKPGVVDPGRLTAGVSTPIEVAMLGPARADLTTVVEQALTRLGKPVPDWPSWLSGPPVRPRSGELRGMFCGGTLCDEAALIVGGRGGAFIDFGDDRYTLGRPHPMIDGSIRLEALRAELADPATGVVLLDVVLGHGADPDPAAHLAPVIAEAAGAAVVVSLVGTAADPQDRDRQARALHAAGAAVFASNAAAARYAARLVA